MMTTERNATYLYIGNVANGNTNGSSAGELIYDDMPLGSVALVKAESYTNGGHIVVDSTIAGSPTQKLQVVNRMSTGEIRISPTFTYADIIGKTKQDHLPSQRQVSFLGYDGTTLAGLESVQALSVGDTFSIKLMFNDRIPYLNNCADIIPIPYYATDATAKTMATGIMNTVRSKFSGTDKPIICERIVAPTVANTVAAITTGDAATLYYFTKDSKTVTAHKAVAASTAITASTCTIATNAVLSIPSYNGRTFTFTAITSVGHLISVGTHKVYVASAGNAAANGNAIRTALALVTNTISGVVIGGGSNATVTITYRDGFYALPPVVVSAPDGSPSLEAITITADVKNDSVPVAYTVGTGAAAAASFLLDIPWQGPTGYAVTATGAVDTYACGTKTVADAWGLKFTGMMSDSLTPTVESYTVVDFDVLAGEYLPTEYKSVAPFKGSGNWMQVKEMENYSQGLDRVHYYAPTEFDVRSYEAVAGKYYDMITINLNQRPYISAGTGINPSNPSTLIIAVSDLTTTAYDYIDLALAIS